MNNEIAYIKAIQLLKDASTENGFLASSNDISNYKRVWARDGVICGLAAIASKDDQLINTFERTIETLATNQHEIGTIPSNVQFHQDDVNISYGGLAGRVDATTWFIIGVCQLAYYKNDIQYLANYKVQIDKCLFLLNAWEFNNNHLIYVPLSGNWADEYITDGYVLYDQLLRLWALKAYNYFEKSDIIKLKITQVQRQIENNFFPDSTGPKIHDKAYQSVPYSNRIPASFSPSGYKTQFDSFAHSLLLLLDLGTDTLKNEILAHSKELTEQNLLHLLPAFWPPIKESDSEWALLKDNCKYEFRNFPFEFHNAGTWSMTNGFYGMALFKHHKHVEAQHLLDYINAINAKQDFSFYENFNTETGKEIGVPNCAWSAAATIMLQESLNNNFQILI